MRGLFFFNEKSDPKKLDVGLDARKINIIFSNFQYWAEHDLRNIHEDKKSRLCVPKNSVLGDETSK